MARPPVGAVILINFPFADFKTYKKRPAIVVAHGSMSTIIICQITSKQTAANIVKLEQRDFQRGSLPIISYIRPDKLLTIDSDSVTKVIGVVTDQKINQVKNSLQQLFR